METKNILIENGTLITPVENGIIKTIKNASILIENDKVGEISTTNKISKNGVDKVIDANKKIIMPSIINTHTHVSMSLLRGLADDLELNSWLNDYIWPMEAKFDSETAYCGALLSHIEMIKSGTTTFNDMYFFMKDVANATIDSGIRACLSHGMIDFGDEEKRNNEIKKSLELLKYCKGKNRLKGFLGPHSPITVSEELLVESRKIANKYGVGLHIHVNETKREVDDILNTKNMRSFQYLENIGFLGDDVIAAHCVWLSDEEIDIIKAHDIKVSYNPSSNMKLSSGIAPIHKLLEKKVSISLGTDGSASNNNLDMFEEIKIASLLQKVHTLNPKVLSADESFKLITINGAKALGLDNEIGSIEIGKKADIILVDTFSPNLTPNTNSLISHLIYSGNGSNVDTTICNGEVLMENKQLKVLNEKDIIEKANGINQKLKVTI
ncbi:MAG: amidohydrolase [Methanobrevibacter sp.]|jgi:5-methylthioadenosine/S-adenosylhomocysteine deaminase|nr:amidohydrolase [Candidatus Methanovirga meridionalis]